MSNSPTVDADGNFFYSDGSDWEPYIDMGEKEGEKRLIADESRMIAELLLNEVLFPNSRKYVCKGWNGGELNIKPETLVLFVACNDTFDYASSDCDSVTISELPNLYDRWKANKEWGSMQWCMIKRNRKPLKYWQDRMKTDGAWEPVFDSLPEN